jgi:hypothetical protein
MKRVNELCLMPSFWGSAPDPGIFEAWLRCPMVSTNNASDNCLVKQSQALRGRNLIRDNQADGAPMVIACISKRVNAWEYPIDVWHDLHSARFL